MRPSKTSKWGLIHTQANSENYGPLLTMSYWLEMSVNGHDEGQKSWYCHKGPVTKNKHAKYETPACYGLKVLINVKAFKMHDKGHSKGQGHKVKILVLVETSCHMEYTCKIWKPHLLRF